MKEQRKSVLVLAMMTAFVATALFLPGLTLAGDSEAEASWWCFTKAWVEKTGQTKTYRLGDDGNLEKGVSWPVPRFRDNGNGTVTDRLTGLTWLKNANCFGGREWDDALDVCNNLAEGQCGLTDGSEPGDWRLPNVRELQSLIHFGFYGPALPNTAGTGQWTEGDPFTGVQSYVYWSSTTSAHGKGDARCVDLYAGIMSYCSKTPYSYFYYVWPVRGRQ